MVRKNFLRIFVKSVLMISKLVLNTNKIISHISKSLLNTYKFLSKIVVAVLHNAV